MAMKGRYEEGYHRPGRSHEARPLPRPSVPYYFEEQPEKPKPRLPGYFTRGASEPRLPRHPLTGRDIRGVGPDAQVRVSKVDK